MTLHNEAKKEDIANIVIMPGDPLRAKYIADNFLEHAQLVNTVRNIYAYTGNYKGKRITVMASGMGMPSMGIYAYELFKFYDVDTIIRIGSCGTFVPEVKLFDTLLVTNSYTEGNFAFSMNSKPCHITNSSEEVCHIIEQTSSNIHIPIIKGTILCNDFFDPYMEDIQVLLNRLPKEETIIGSEMESFALFYIANALNKKSACLLTVVDSMFEKRSISAEERQNSLNNMITLALESSLSL